jgi:glycine oxidase
MVIGGGVMGLAAARELRRGGRSVLLLERAQPGRAASWASAGIIGATTRDEADPGYQLRQISHAAWPSFAETLLEESGNDPEYRENGCLYLAANDAELAWLQRLAQNPAAPTAKPASLLDQQNPAARHAQSGSLLDQQQLRELEPALDHGLRGALLVQGGNVEPRRLCRSLEISTRRLGVEIYSGVEVTGLITRNDTVQGVQTADGSSMAETVVLAAGAWSASIGGVMPQAPVRPQRGQILALDQTRVGIKHVLLTPGDPYFVPRCDGRLVIGATREEAGWDASLTAAGVAWLLNRAMQVAPSLADCPIAEIWTGFRPVSADGLPLIGPGELRGLYFLTGHGPSGISPLPGSVALLMAHLTGDKPPIAPEPFSPLRFSARTKV